MMETIQRKYGNGMRCKLTSFSMFVPSMKKKTAKSERNMFWNKKETFFLFRSHFKWIWNFKHKFTFKNFIAGSIWCLFVVVPLLSSSTMSIFEEEERPTCKFKNEEKKKISKIRERIHLSVGMLVREGTRFATNYGRCNFLTTSPFQAKLWFFDVRRNEKKMNFAFCWKQETKKL